MNEFRNGNGSTTQIGYVNRNEQRCDGQRGVAGTDHCQVAYKMTCLRINESGNICSYTYGANGADVFQRKCPRCQNGAEGIAY